MSTQSDELKKIYAAYRAFLGSVSEKSQITFSETGDALGLYFLSFLILIGGVIIGLLLFVFKVLVIVPTIVILVCVITAFLIRRMALLSANTIPNVINIGILAKEQIIYQSRDFSGFSGNTYYIYVYIKNGYRVDSKGSKTKLTKLFGEDPNFKGKYRFQVNSHLWDDLQLGEEIEIVTTKGCYVFDKLINILTTDNPKYPFTH